jgi:hypothetical protein
MICLTACFTHSQASAHSTYICGEGG